MKNDCRFPLIVQVMNNRLIDDVSNEKRRKINESVRLVVSQN
jgi:hypothetical protein